MALRSHSAFRPERSWRGEHLPTDAMDPYPTPTWADASFADCVWCAHLGRPPLTKTAGPTRPLACTRYPGSGWDAATGSGSGRTGVRGSGLGRDLIHRSQAPPWPARQPAAPEPRNRPPPTTTHTHQARPPPATRHTHQAPPGTPRHGAHTPRRPTTRSCGRPDWRSRAGGLQRPALVQCGPRRAVSLPVSVPPHERCLTREGGPGQGPVLLPGSAAHPVLPFPSLSPPILNIVILDFFRGHSFFFSCLLDPSLSFFFLLLLSF